MSTQEPQVLLPPRLPDAELGKQDSWLHAVNRVGGLEGHLTGAPNPATHTHDSPVSLSHHQAPPVRGFPGHIAEVYHIMTAS